MEAIGLWVGALFVAALAPVIVDGFQRFLTRRRRDRTLEVLARARALHRDGPPN